MEAVLKKEYNFNSLCCVNCASIIEQEVGALEGLTASKVDFTSKKLTLAVEDEETLESLSGQIENIAKKYDSEIVIKNQEPGKKVIYLNGLDCANCAQKIENAVKKLDGVNMASVDFATERLTIETADKNNLPAILRAASQIVLSVEPDVKISYTNKTFESESADWKERLSQIGLALGAVLFAVGLIFTFSQPVEFTMFLFAYLLAGWKVLFRAIQNITKGQVFDENFLMSVATIGAFAIGEYPEGVAVMLFYQVGELLQDLAVNRSRKSISTLMDIRPDYANLKIGEAIRKVTPEEVGIGDLIVVTPGEKIPLDGKVADGKSSLDTSALTGESLPRDVEVGDTVLSGSVNKSGLLTIEVTKEFGESTVSKILDLVQNASSQKAPTENFITKFAHYYTPVVVFGALALAIIPPLVVPGATFAEWINRGLIFLVISCPCALVVSIPLSFFGGIGGASKNGVLVKGSNYLEALNSVDTVVFDKTGTLTKGNFKVTEIKTANGFAEDEVLTYAAHAEGFSGHPIAVSIREAFGKEIDIQRISDYEEVSGHGIRVKVDGKSVLAGNAKLMDAEKIKWPNEAAPGTVVYIAIDGAFAGYLIISDEIKPDSQEAIRRLKAAGIRKTVMLTGDNRTTGEKVGKKLGLDAVYTELLPQQKVEKMEDLFKEVTKGKKLVFVGDGINDAPVLARADIGVAMGGLGSDAAIEAADVVLMTDEPSKLVSA
ncbi:MAG TPA: heavy metal translocating P-type ATPase, partial [Syntrophomonas sp.]|nr:heavy metal translocating P-type ATPase [Syntrophomonas sp.]